MMNYKLVQTGLSAIPGKGDFETQAYDIIETKTNQVIACDVPGYMNEAKNLCRHLNMGGGFDGNTPPFFLARLQFAYSSGE